jgi:hypothetical protein
MNTKCIWLWGHFECLQLHPKAKRQSWTKQGVAVLNCHKVSIRRIDHLRVHSPSTVQLSSTKVFVHSIQPREKPYSKYFSKSQGSAPTKNSKRDGFKNRPQSVWARHQNKSTDHFHVQKHKTNGLWTARVSKFPQQQKKLLGEKGTEEPFWTNLPSHCTFALSLKVSPVYCKNPTLTSFFAITKVRKVI